MTAYADVPPPEEPLAEDDELRREPHDEAAEASVLGAALLSRDAYDEAVARGMKGHHFWTPKHETIWDAMTRLRARGDALDAVTVADELGGDVSRIGGPAYLHHLLSTTPTAANVGHYVRIVRKHARSRAMTAAGRKITALGYQHTDDPEAMCAAAEAILREATDTDADVLGSGIADDLDSLIDEIETGVNSLPTPWRSVNQIIGGWVDGGLYVIAGGTAVGKSVAGAQAAMDCARRHGKLAAVGTGEMSVKQYQTRGLAHFGLADLGHLSRGGAAVTDQDWHGIMRGRRLLEEGGPNGGPLPVHIVSASGMTPIGAHAAVRAAERRWRTPVSAFVFDYLQLGAADHVPGRRIDNRQAEVAAIAYGLKGLALMLSIPVIALAQLNRAPMTSDRRPGLSDLRESGAIEQAADAVILLSREKTEDGEETGHTIFDIAKHRQGQPGETALRFDGAHSRFLDPARNDEEATLL